MTFVISDVSLRELIINPFVHNILLLYPLKTENRRVFLKTSENLILLGGRERVQWERMS